MKRFLLCSMKLFRNCFLILSVVALGLTCATNTHAGIITQWEAVGPGLGEEEPWNNWEFGEYDSTGGNVYGYGKLFENTGYIDLLMLVQNDEQTNDIIFVEYIINQSGVDWTDYHLELGFVTLPEPNGNGDEYDYGFVTIESELMFYGYEEIEETFTKGSLTPADKPYAIDLNGGIVPDEEIYELAIGFYLPDFDIETMPERAVYPYGEGDQYIIALRQMPTTSVPEPSTMLLLGLGLVVLAGLSRKKFIKK